MKIKGIMMYHILCCKCRSVTKVTWAKFKELADNGDITVLSELWRNDGLWRCNHCEQSDDLE